MQKKLSLEQCFEIKKRLELGAQHEDLAKNYGVAKSTIYYAIRRAAKQKTYSGNKAKRVIFRPAWKERCFEAQNALKDALAANRQNALRIATLEEELKSFPVKEVQSSNKQDELLWSLIKLLGNRA